MSMSPFTTTQAAQILALAEAVRELAEMVQRAQPLPVRAKRWTWRERIVRLFSRRRAEAMRWDRRIREMPTTLDVGGVAGAATAVASCARRMLTRESVERLNGEADYRHQIDGTVAVLRAERAAQASTVLKPWEESA